MRSAPVRFAGVALGALLMTSAALAVQASTAPALHQRGGADADSPTPSAQGNAHVHLPPEAEGEYQWGDSGEVINLYVQDGRLEGFMTQRSERRQVNSTPITFNFDKASAYGNQVTFTTHAVHGDWYSFSGSLVRGTAVSPRIQGYYLLNGTLTSHFHAQVVGGDTQEQTNARVVSLKHGGLLP